jgi:hypothetical protein
LVLVAALTVLNLGGLGGACAKAQAQPLSAPANPPPAAVRLSLEEARQRALANSKVLALAAENI